MRIAIQRLNQLLQGMLKDFFFFCVRFTNILLNIEYLWFFCSLCYFFLYLDLVYIGNLYLVCEQTYLDFCSCQISLFTRSLVVVLECFLVVHRQKAGDFFMFFSYSTDSFKEASFFF